MPLEDLALNSGRISFYPVPDVYTGDMVTIQVVPHMPAGLSPNDVDVQVWIDGELVVESNINGRNLGGQPFGIYRWVWPAGDEAGEHLVTAVLDPNNHVQIGDEDPGNNSLSVVLPVRPRAELPATEANATWVTETTACCLVHVISDTAAHRDLAEILPVVDAAFARAAEMLVERPSGLYEVYLVDRVIGQGGYADKSTAISYLDRDYVGGGLAELITHEAVHLIDQAFAPRRLTFLSEGLAVWVAGGHYRPQNLGQRMAALVEMGGYLPLAHVIDNFHGIQHEVSYLESASFIEYLVGVYGWQGVRAFYVAATADDGPTLSAAVDANLRRYFNRSLELVEGDWLAYVADLPRDPAAKADLQAMIRYYEVVRRYQAIYDPSAYYLFSWLPAPDEAKAHGMTADFSRRPETEINLALETMLHQAKMAMQAGEYERGNALLDSVTRVLDYNGQFLDPLGSGYLQIVRLAAAAGYEVQQIDVRGERATALATRLSRPALIPLRFILVNHETWQMAP